MTLADLSFETYSSLESNKARSGLTILGIVIGICSVIALVSVGQGATASITSIIRARRDPPDRFPAVPAVLQH